MDFAEALDRDGFAFLPRVLDEASLQALVAAFPWMAEPSRRPVPLDPLKLWLEATGLTGDLGCLLGAGARPVRALMMGKGEGQDWDIGWHRDTTFAVAEPREVEGFDSWVAKGPFYQVQAPEALVGRMLSLRIHLDDAGLEQGPLLVRPGSHRSGGAGPIAVAARRGQVLAMNPLLLHASERPRSPAPRRVLHVEWAGFELPGGLRWAWF
ncbi:MAG TPA: phytanoyl-CoA dioxygenase family protein [Holophagaceae bacterium]|nr:phytanoyl-CoA dioxygenase family protein [Holophagaceae bacterium]